MRTKFHPDSGAIEFFPDPQEIAVMEVQNENKRLEAENEDIRKRLKSIMRILAENNIIGNDKIEEELSGLDTDQLKAVCRDLGLNVGNVKRDETLVLKITDSDIPNSAIASSIDKVKGV